MTCLSDSHVKCERAKESDSENIKPLVPKLRSDSVDGRNNQTLSENVLVPVPPHPDFNVELGSFLHRGSV